MATFESKTAEERKCGDFSSRVYASGGTSECSSGLAVSTGRMPVDMMNEKIVLFINIPLQ